MKTAALPMHPLPNRRALCQRAARRAARPEECGGGRRDISVPLRQGRGRRGPHLCQRSTLGHTSAIKASRPA